MAYDTIIGCGPNSAVLHFMPTGRVLRRGELVLIDAGAEYLGYVSDITRTFCVGGVMTEPSRSCTRSFTPRERGGDRARARPASSGVTCTGPRRWRSPRASSASGSCAATPSRWWSPARSACSSRTGSATWSGSVSATPASRSYERRHEPPPYPNLRIDLPLEPGMVVTVEPGVYFVPALLQDPERRARHRDEVDWDRVDRMLGFGGIRIEDNVLVTADGHEVITADVPLL